MRVLSSAGLKVGAVASQPGPAPSFRSRYCAARATITDFAVDPAAYVDELLEIVRRHRVPLVIPAHDGSISALRKRRADVEAVTALPIAAERGLDLAINKDLTLGLAAELKVRIPRSITARDLSDVRAASRELGLPAVIKPAESWLDGMRTGLRFSSSCAIVPRDLERAAETIFAGGGRVIVQEWLPGRREAVSVFRGNGQTVAEFAQRSYREWPVLGGASVFYESIPLRADLVRPTRSLLDAMDLESCSVVEFRGDHHGHPVLMEVNPRMAGSVSLAIRCGVDFPGMLRAHALGLPLTPVTNYPAGRRLRWLAGDIGSLRNNFALTGSPDAVSPARAVTRFLTNFVTRPSAVDPYDWRDLTPAATELRAIVSGYASKAVQRLVWRSPAKKEVRP